MTSIPAAAAPLSAEQLDAELAARGVNAAEFLPLDTEQPLDVEARIAQTPLEKRTKGMFLEKLAREAHQAGGASETRYASFGDYPLRDFMRLLADYAPAHYPGVPLREAFRQAGSEAFSTLMSSVAGRALLVMARSDIRSALRLTPEAYKHNLSHCSVQLSFEGSRQAILEFRDVWNFPDCYHVGIIEGLCRTFGAEGRVCTRVHSECDVDLLVRW
jgi:uncharacterized protein (TIGR02265 family)